MITGAVNSRREAVVSIPIIGATGQSQPIGAVIDIAFNCFLAIPPDVIAAFGDRSGGGGHESVGGLDGKDR